MTTRGRALVLTAAVLVAGLATGPAQSAPARAASSVVALVGERGIEVLHAEFATMDGRDAVLPPALAARAVRVPMPDRRWDYERRLAALRSGPLGRLRPNTLYYLSGTRLLVWTGSQSTRDAGVHGREHRHGTGTASLVAGRTVGTAPQSLLVAALGHSGEAWTWVAQQPEIDVATASGFDALAGSAPLLCEGARAAAAFRRSGRLPYFIAGNGLFETLAFSPGHTPDVVRVGGVHTDGTPFHGQTGAANYSSHGYDVAEAWTSPMAAAGDDQEHELGSGTSGATPRVAGRAANLLLHARRLVGDTGTGARGGALVVAKRGARLPRSGPLADGRLTADELLEVQLATSRPSMAAEGVRYGYEGFGWANAQAEQQARAVLSGTEPLPARPLDTAAHEAALAARAGVTAAKGCGAPLP